MKKRIIYIAAAMFPLISSAESLTPLNAQSVYFEIGGGDVIRAPLAPSSNRPTLQLGASYGMSGSLSCDMWDGVHLNLDRYLEIAEDHLNDQVNELQSAIVTSIVGAAQGAVTAALQRAMPGLYDWSMNVNSQIEFDVDSAKQSCEQAMSAVHANVNPMQGWIDQSVSFDWESRLEANVAEMNGGAAPGDDSQNVIRSARSVATEKGEQDIPWFNGVAGGSSGEVIEVISDSVIAGYQIQAGSNDLANGGVAAPQTVDYYDPGNANATARPQRLLELWGSGDIAATWVTEVVGEETVAFCEACDPSSQPGRGLQPKVLEEANEMAQAWTTVITNNGGNLRDVTLATLDTLSSDRIRITHAVMEALDGMEAQDQRTFMKRMASDVGLSRAVEKAMAARSLLKTALSTHEVQGNDEAKIAVERQISRLTDEVESIVWEVEIANKMGSKTPASLIALHERKLYEASTTPVSSGSIKTRTTLMPEAPFIAQ